MASLQGKYIVFDVCNFFFKKKKKCVLLVPFVRFSLLDLPVCRHFLDRVFSCSAPGYDDPLETTLPSTLEGSIHKYSRILLLTFLCSSDDR